MFFLAETPGHVIILGSGGMDTLAALHRHEIESKYRSFRYFIPCDSAPSSAELISVAAMYFGLREPVKLTQTINRCLSLMAGPKLVVLDNLETSWEPIDSRPLVEEFLSLLTDIPQLTLVVGPFRGYSNTRSELLDSGHHERLSDQASSGGRGRSYLLSHH